MIAHEFPGSTPEFNPLRQTTQLPLVQAGDCLVSRWKPSPEEIQTLIRGGSVELWVQAKEVPPTRIVAVDRNAGVPEPAKPINMELARAAMSAHSGWAAILTGLPASEQMMRLWMHTLCAQAEVRAILTTLIEKSVVSPDEWTKHVLTAVATRNAEMENVFPGYGMKDGRAVVLNETVAAETRKVMRLFGEGGPPTEEKEEL